MFKIPIEKHTELAIKYLSGISSIKLAKEYNADLKTVLNTLRRKGVKIRTAKENSRKYPIKENFFDKIDNQKKAYFLGYLFADGCNLGKKVSLNLSEKDLSILKRLNKLIHPKGKPLYKGRPRKSLVNNTQIAHIKLNYHLLIENKHVADILSSYGCTPRKTNTLKFPSCIRTHLIPHFIRGYFDGDGSLCLFGKKPCINAYVSITGTSFFCEKIQNILNTFNVKSKILLKNYKTENVVELRITKIRSILKFLEWVYKDSTIHLKRKYLLYIKLIKNRKLHSMKEPKKCCICGKNHYGKNYCNKHYQDYNRKISALFRAKKSLFDFLTLNNDEKRASQIIKHLF